MYTQHCVIQAMYMQLYEMSTDQRVSPFVSSSFLKHRSLNESCIRTHSFLLRLRLHQTRSQNVLARFWKIVRQSGIGLERVKGV